MNLSDHIKESTSHLRFINNEPMRRVDHHYVAKCLGVRPYKLIARAAVVFANPMPITKTTTGRRGHPTHHRWMLLGEAARACYLVAKTSSEAYRASEAISAVFRYLDYQDQDQRSRAALAPALTKAKEARDQIIELEARLELQNRHLKRHAEFTRETHEEIKQLRSSLASERVNLRAAQAETRSSSEHLAKSQDCIVKLEQDLKLADEEIGRLRAQLDRVHAFRPAASLNVAPSHKYARAGWFSYQVAPDVQKYEGFRAAHGLELLAEVGACDRRGVPTQAGRPYCAPDGASYKWDMALVELMRVSTDTQAA